MPLNVRQLVHSRQLNLFDDELIVDNFAGGGGASTGIAMALGREVDIAINHDPEAIAMHSANHHLTKHYCESVFEVDPIEVCDGKPVGLAWFSPDCKHFSKAKGGKPVDKNIRGLAWVATRWAKRVRPRLIILENVEEFLKWGPLVGNLPNKAREGELFRQFVRQLERYGYVVEYRILRACDFGAPTTRKRLFLIARCDGQPIVWPEPTHASPKSPTALGKKLKPWRTASEIIDWSLPCPSIFDRKKPLAENTLRRIAKGIEKFLLGEQQPFIVTCNHDGDGFRGQQLDEPFRTVTATRDAHGLVIPNLIQVSWGEREGQAPRVPGLDKPMGVTPAGGIKHALAVATLIKHYGGNYKGDAIELAQPLHTITAQDHHSLVTANLIRFFGTADAHSLDEPLRTIMADGAGGKFGMVQAFLLKYYGKPEKAEMQSLDDPLHTVTARHRFALITIRNEQYIMVDIGMRMLEPHELFAAQGFPKNYVIRPNFKGKPLSKSAQVRMVGNSVSPVLACALVKANYKSKGEIAA